VVTRAAYIKVDMRMPAASAIHLRWPGPAIVLWHRLLTLSRTVSSIAAKACSTPQSLGRRCTKTQLPARGPADPGSKPAKNAGQIHVKNLNFL
jgi:hypothetical protein